MSKIGETKKRILESLKSKSKTATDLSKELNLALPTVTEHIHALEEMGAIKEIDDIPRKWKYYELNPSYVMEERSFLRKYSMYLVGIAIIAIAIGALYINSNPSYKPAIAAGCVPVSGYTCSSIQVSSSGMLNMIIGGFNTPVRITGIACSNGSTQPSSFGPVNISIVQGGLAGINIACPTSTHVMTVGVWINYTVYGVQTVARVANVTIAPPPKATTTSTSTTTTIVNNTNSTIGNSSKTTTQNSVNTTTSTTTSSTTTTTINSPVPKGGCPQAYNETTGQCVPYPSLGINTTTNNTQHHYGHASPPPTTTTTIISNSSNRSRG
ncbi:MAG: ArsR/SmtB family transcription factor [Candidatus Micrarchaeales archaeon]